MGSAIALDEKQTTEIADKLAQASNQVLELRIALTDRRPPTPSAVLHDLKQYESHLDQMVSFFRAHGIYLINQGAQQALANVNTAIDQGRKTVADIEHAHAAIKAAAGLQDLAAALLSRNPLAIAEAADSLRT